MIGHCVVIEGNRKMTGCLQTFCGHCINVSFNQLEYHSTFYKFKETLMRSGCVTHQQIYENLYCGTLKMLGLYLLAQNCLHLTF